jgi:predicted alpha/beta-fold hydrolase
MPHAFPTFRPHPLVRGGHAQTLVGAYLPHGGKLTGTVDHRIEMPDGDVLVLHDNRPAVWQPGERVVLMIHGLGGAHHSPYCERLALRLTERGVRTFRLDQRGCGAGVNLARYPGHAGRSEDATAAIERVAQLCPGSPVSAIGYSLGGNIILKLAGECGASPPGGLDQVAAVCPPIDLRYCARSISRGFNWVYDRAFIRSLTRLVEARATQSPEFYEKIPLRPRPYKLEEFDNRITAPLSGFRDSAHYYEVCSSAPLLTQIAVPTLILSAADDPLIPADMFETTPHSSAVQIHVASSGGHLGFLAAKNGDPDRRWLDWRLMEWMGVGIAQCGLRNAE